MIMGSKRKGKEKEKREGTRDQNGGRWKEKGWSKGSLFYPHF